MGWYSDQEIAMGQSVVVVEGSDDDDVNKKKKGVETRRARRMRFLDTEGKWKGKE